MSGLDYRWYPPVKGMASSKKFKYGMDTKNIMLMRGSKQKLISFDEIESVSLLSPRESVDVISSLRGPDLQNRRLSDCQLGRVTEFLSVPVRAAYKDVGTGTTIAYKPRKDTKTILLVLKNGEFLVISPQDPGGFYSALGSRRVSLKPMSNVSINIIPMSESKEWVNRYSTLGKSRKKFMFLAMGLFFLGLAGFMVFMFYTGEFTLEGELAAERAIVETEVQESIEEVIVDKSVTEVLDAEPKKRPLIIPETGFSIDLPVAWLDDHNFVFAVSREGLSEAEQAGVVTDEIVYLGSSLMVDFMVVNGDVKIRPDELEPRQEFAGNYISSAGMKIDFQGGNFWTGEASMLYLINSYDLKNNMISLIRDY